MMSELRYDQLHDTHVLIAPERLKRPQQFTAHKTQQAMNPAKCPFCEGNEALTPPEIYAIRPEASVSDTPGWKSRVVPNLYRAVSIETPHQHHMNHLLHYWEGFGAHEVIIDTPKHHAMQFWTQDEYIHWFEVMQTRLKDLHNDARIAHISLFKNQGPLAGGTQEHPHSQLIAVPIVPKVQRDLYERSAVYFKAHHRALLHDLIAEECETGERLIAEEGDWVALCPYASQYAFEVVISTKTTALQLDTMSHEQMKHLSALLEQLFTHLHKELGEFDYNVLISTPPLHMTGFEGISMDEMRKALPFSLRITPRLYREGGFELSTGVYINPISPELAAKQLRESLNA
jgi:UDPglucose--hexose-1-phosphate uridylyltransferase